MLELSSVVLACCCNIEQNVLETQAQHRKAKKQCLIPLVMQQGRYRANKNLSNYLLC